MWTVAYLPPLNPTDLTPKPPVTMFRSRSHLQAFALWLALAGVVLRSLVPIGFMPGWTGAAGDGDDARWLIICPTSPLYGALATPVAAKPHHDHAAMLAAQAAAAAAADPHAHHHGLHGHHAGMDHGAAGDAVPVATAAADPHAGHDPGQHGGHRIAAEHLSCPFAGAGSPALPTAALAFLVADHGTSTPDVAAPADAVPPVRRRLPPARAPPAAIDDRAVA